MAFFFWISVVFFGLRGRGAYDDDDDGDDGDDERLSKLWVLF